MKTHEADSGPVTPGLIQLDERTLVSVRLARFSAAPVQFRAVALAVLQSNRRVPLASSQTAGFGPDPQSALDECLGRVRAKLRGKRPLFRGQDRRPEATL